MSGIFRLTRHIEWPGITPFDINNIHISLVTMVIHLLGLGVYIYFDNISARGTEVVIKQKADLTIVRKKSVQYFWAVKDPLEVYQFLFKQILADIRTVQNTSLVYDYAVLDQIRQALIGADGWFPRKPVAVQPLLPGNPRRNAACRYRFSKPKIHAICET